MNNIFISYRRADSADVVGRIYDHLEGIVGAENIFKDVHSVQLGIDYLKFTAEAVGNCHVQLAIIGHEWLNGRRIDDPNDRRDGNVVNWRHPGLWPRESGPIDILAQSFRILLTRLAYCVPQASLPRWMCLARDA